MHTSDVRGAGTDAAVFVNLYGASGGSSGPQELLAGPEAFERARLDSFRLQLRHVGELRKLAVGHDSSGSSSAWHLAKVVVVEEGGQVRGRGEYGLLGGCTLALQSPTAAADYQLLVLPGVAESCWAPLHPNGCACISCSNALKPDQYLSSPCRPQPVVFPCNRWIGTPGQEGPVAQPQEQWVELLPDTLPPAIKQYDVTVATSDLKGAGTDARIQLHIFGSGGQVLGPLPLEAPGTFERGQADRFSLTGADVGQISKIRVTSDLGGQRPAWHLDTVTIKVRTPQEAPARPPSPAGKAAAASAAAAVRASLSSLTAAAEPEAVYLFPCGAWLDQLHGASKELLPGGAGGGPAGATYSLTLHTSDLRGAGTDAGVEVNIIGSGGATGWQRLAAGQSAFERGCVDSFRLAGLPDVGQVSKLVVRSDGRAQEPGWHLHKVVLCKEEQQASKRAAAAVTSAQDTAAPAPALIQPSGTSPSEAAASGKTTSNDTSSSSRPVYFSARRWLDQVHGWQAELMARDSDPDGDQQQYRVAVQTSDLRGAGTDACVYIAITGERGVVSGPHALTHPVTSTGSSGAGPFDRGGWDKFQIMCPPLGQLQRLRAWTDRPAAAGSAGCWHLDFAMVTCPAGQDVFFVHKGWVGREEVADMAATGVDPRAGMGRYEVRLWTSDMRGAGTDAQVGGWRGGGACGCWRCLQS